MTTLHLALENGGYDITVGHGLIESVGKYFNLNRKVFIVTDSGVPEEYAKKVAACCKESVIVTVDEGEGSKSLKAFGELSQKMLDFGMTRTDCAVAVGGGVVGDLTGFVSASYMRGIDFYNFPTTVLSQVDSSIGGKTAINFGGIKNIIGAFHQPKAVVIDTDVLKTLPARQISNGLAEAVKMSLTSDKELFEFFEKNEITEENIEEVIVRALKIKKAVVEEDERESGLRKILNFGHTFGHAVEAEEEMNGMYHGECVAIGMTVACSDAVKARLIPILNRLRLPTRYDGNVKAALEHVVHDKKCDGGAVSVIEVNEIGTFDIVKMPVEDYVNRILTALR